MSFVPLSEIGVAQQVDEGNIMGNTEGGLGWHSNFHHWVSFACVPDYSGLLSFFSSLLFKRHTFIYFLLSLILWNLGSYESGK